MVAGALNLEFLSMCVYRLAWVQSSSFIILSIIKQARVIEVLLLSKHIQVLLDGGILFVWLKMRMGVSLVNMHAWLYFIRVIENANGCVISKQARFCC